MVLGGVLFTVMGAIVGAIVGAAAVAFADTVEGKGAFFGAGAVVSAAARAACS